jgi:hypothetical protein
VGVPHLLGEKVSCDPPKRTAALGVCSDLVVQIIPVSTTKLRQTNNAGRKGTLQ